MNRYEVIYEALENLMPFELMALWNEYCDRHGYYDDRVENMDFFDEEFDCLTPTQIIDLVDGCDFSTSHNYYKHTTYGLESANDIEDLIDIDNLASYMDDNEEYFNDPSIESAVEEWEEEQEQDEEEESEEMIA